MTTIVDMTTDVDQLQRIREQLKTMKATEEALLAKLKNEMWQAGLSELEGTHVKVVRKNIVTNRLDTKAVREDHGTKYDKTSSYDRFDLKPIVA